MTSQEQAYEYRGLMRGIMATGAAFGKQAKIPPSLSRVLITDARQLRSEC